MPLTPKNRQEAQNQPYTCPADREGLDRDRVNNFHLPCNLCVYCVLVSSIFLLKACMQNETYKVKLRTNYLLEQDSRRHALTFVSIEDNVRLISQVFQQFQARSFSSPEPVVSWSRGLETRRSLQIKPSGSGEENEARPLSNNSNRIIIIIIITTIFIIKILRSNQTLKLTMY